MPKIIRLFAFVILLSIASTSNADFWSDALACLENPCSCGLSNQKETWGPDNNTMKQLSFQTYDYQKEDGTNGDGTAKFPWNAASDAGWSPGENSVQPNTICPPWGRYEGRHNCLKQFDMPNEIFWINYRVYCAEAVTNQDFTNPSIRVRMQSCNILGCFTESTTLNGGSAECVTWPTQYGLPTIRFCARIAVNNMTNAKNTDGSIKRDADGNVLLSYNPDPGYYLHFLDTNGYPRPDVGKKTQNGLYTAYLPKICLYEDPSVIEGLTSWSEGYRCGQEDWNDTNIYYQPQHANIAGGSECNKSKLTIGTFFGAQQQNNAVESDYFFNHIGDTSNYGGYTARYLHFTSAMTSDLPAPGSGNFKTSYKKWVQDFVVNKTPSSSDSGINMVGSGLGCVFLALGPFPPPFCSVLTPSPASISIQEICAQKIAVDTTTSATVLGLAKSTTTSPCVRSSVARNNFINNSLRISLDNVLPICADPKTDTIATKTCVKLYPNYLSSTVLSPLEAAPPPAYPSSLIHTINNDVLPKCALSTPSDGKPCIVTSNAVPACPSGATCDASNFRIVYGIKYNANSGLTQINGYPGDLQNIADCNRLTTSYPCVAVYGINIGQYSDFTFNLNGTVDPTNASCYQSGTSFALADAKGSYVINPYISLAGPTAPVTVSGTTNTIDGCTSCSYVATAPAASTCTPSSATPILNPNSMCVTYITPSSPTAVSAGCIKRAPPPQLSGSTSSTTTYSAPNMLVKLSYPTNTNVAASSNTTPPSDLPTDPLVAPTSLGKDGACIKTPITPTGLCLPAQLNYYDKIDCTTFPTSINRCTTDQISGDTPPCPYSASTSTTISSKSGSPIIYINSCSSPAGSKCYQTIPSVITANSGTDPYSLPICRPSGAKSGLTYTNTCPSESNSGSSSSSSPGTPINTAGSAGSGSTYNLGTITEGTTNTTLISSTIGTTQTTTNPDGSSTAVTVDSLCNYTTTIINTDGSSTATTIFANGNTNTVAITPPPSLASATTTTTTTTTSTPTGPIIQIISVDNGPTTTITQNSDNSRTTVINNIDGTTTTIATSATGSVSSSTTTDTYSLQLDATTANTDQVQGLVGVRNLTSSTYYNIIGYFIDTLVTDSQYLLPPFTDNKNVNEGPMSIFGNYLPTGTYPLDSNGNRVSSPYYYTGGVEYWNGIYNRGGTQISAAGATQTKCHSPVMSSAANLTHNSTLLYDDTNCVLTTLNYYDIIDCSIFPSVPKCSAAQISGLAPTCPYSSSTSRTIYTILGKPAFYVNSCSSPAGSTCYQTIPSVITANDGIDPYSAGVCQPSTSPSNRVNPPPTARAPLAGYYSFANAATDTICAPTEVTAPKGPGMNTTNSGGVAYNTAKCGVRNKTIFELGASVDIPGPTCPQVTAASSSTGFATWKTTPDIHGDPADGSTNVGSQAIGTCKVGYAPPAGSPPTGGLQPRTCVIDNNDNSIFLPVTTANTCIPKVCPAITVASAASGYATWSASTVDSSSTGTCMANYGPPSGGLQTRACSDSGSGAQLSALLAENTCVIKGCAAITTASATTGYATWPSANIGSNSTGTCMADYVPPSGGLQTRACSASGSTAQFADITAGNTCTLPATLTMGALSTYPASWNTNTLTINATATNAKIGLKKTTVLGSTGTSPNNNLLIAMKATDVGQYSNYWTCGAQQEFQAIITPTVKGKQTFTISLTGLPDKNWIYFSYSMTSTANNDMNLKWTNYAGGDKTSSYESSPNETVTSAKYIGTKTSYVNYTDTTYATQLFERLIVHGSNTPPTLSGYVNLDIGQTATLTVQLYFVNLVDSDNAIRAISWDLYHLEALTYTNNCSTLPK